MGGNQSRYRRWYYRTANVSRWFIYSEGGDVDASIAIIDQIKAAQKFGIKVYTINAGIAYSAAGIILAMGDKGCRYSYKNAAAMLHPCSFSLPHDYNEHQAKAMDFVQRTINNINGLIAEACGISSKKQSAFMKDIEKGLWLNAEEAQKYGIIDTIITEPWISLLDDKKETKNGHGPKVSAHNKRGIRKSLQGSKQSKYH
jgi:ATP-dependent protease ClpP protease subunit